jgi:hypothetical protein
MRTAARSFILTGMFLTIWCVGVNGPLSPRAAFAAPAGGDAVTVWNANAGVAATKACIASFAQTKLSQFQTSKKHENN